MLFLRPFGSVFDKQLHRLAAAHKLAVARMKHFHDIAALHAFIDLLFLGHFDTSSNSYQFSPKTSKYACGCAHAGQTFGGSVPSKR
jgi:hypothetical protein